MKIVSLVPSFTELLFDLDLEDSLVGITRFCIHPKQKTKLITKVGGTKNLKLDVIAQLQPDLIIANKEENQKEDIEALQSNFNVWVTEITTINDALEMIKELGIKTKRETQALRLIDEIQSEFKTIEVSLNTKPSTVAYLIWQSPIMLAGRDTFINQLLAKVGFTNVLTKSNSRYPEKTEEQIIELNPDYIFLSSEPFPFKEKHKSHFQSIFSNSKVILVDGEMFSWYGSRMKLAATYFNSLTRNLN